MEQLSQIRKRIQSISEIRKITKAMGLISAVHLRDSREQEFMSHPFITHCALTIAELVKREPEMVNKLLSNRKFLKTEPYPVRFYVLTGDRGLSGDYNDSILAVTENLLKQKKKMLLADGYLEPKFELCLTGKIGRERLKKAGYNVDDNFSFSIEEPTYYYSMDLADHVMESAKRGEVAEVYFVYCRLDTAISTEALYTKVFPVDAESMLWLSKTRNERENEKREKIKIDLAKRSRIRSSETSVNQTDINQTEDVNPAQRAILPFAFEGDEETVISYLIGTYANALVYGMLTEAFASELLSRMTSMEGATRNADELMQKLTRLRNQYRQAQITTELSEIVSSAEAITKGDNND